MAVAQTSSTEQLLNRLGAALAALEDAVEQRVELGRGASDLEEEVHRLSNDRSRLAQALDSAQARAVRLEEVNRDVSRRLVSAMESIRSVLERQGS